MIHCCHSFFVTVLDLLLSSVLFVTFNDSLLSFVLLLPLTILYCHGRWRGVGWGLFITVTDSLLSVIPLPLLLILYSHWFFHQRYCVFVLFLFLFTLTGSFIMVTDHLITYSQSFCYQRYSFFTDTGSFIAVTDCLLTPVLLSPLLIV